jgi:hypothetical protein
MLISKQCILLYAQQIRSPDPRPIKTESWVGEYYVGVPYMGDTLLHLFSYDNQVLIDS